MQRTLDHAERTGFTKYTSTLEEAWRLSISGLTASISMELERHCEVVELGPDEDYSNDTLTEFGLIEAKRHRARGITLSMFLGLMKYYRLSYLELMAERWSGSETLGRDRLFVERCFDRIEIAFCEEWSKLQHEQRLLELQESNRKITNEKNAYLTAFESLTDPVIILDLEERVVNLNHAASLLIDPGHIPGGHYYQPEPRSDSTSSFGKRPLDKACIGRAIADVLPWLVPALSTLKSFAESGGFECEAHVLGTTRLFEVKRSEMLDLSEKFTATIVILRDVTTRKQTEAELRRSVFALGEALSDVKRLSGLLPICASCKKVRDDKGYWQQVDSYISAHSEATFSHGICPDCLVALFPDLGS